MATNVSGFRYGKMIFDLLEEYKGEVDASLLAESSKKDYKMFAEFFVRWLVDDFTPGAYIQGNGK